jgi:hypothetical protein
MLTLNITPTVITPTLIRLTSIRRLRALRAPTRRLLPVQAYATATWFSRPFRTRLLVPLIGSRIAATLRRHRRQ